MERHPERARLSPASERMMGFATRRETYGGISAVVTLV